MSDEPGGTAVDEDARPCAWCGERAVAECAGCDVAACADPAHLDGLGLLFREGGPFYLFFFEASGLPVCSMCLSLPRAEGMDPEGVEGLRQICPWCSGPITRVRVDGVEAGKRPDARGAADHPRLHVSLSFRSRPSGRAELSRGRRWPSRVGRRGLPPAFPAPGPNGRGRW